MPTPPFIPTAWPIYQGDVATFSITVEENDSLVDLSAAYRDWSASIKVRGDKLPYALVVDDSHADEGVIKVTAPSAVTKTMRNYGVFDLQAKHILSGETRTFVRGKTAFTREVTRD